MLYHFSEESSIKIFEPRESKSYPGMQPAVWAIDAAHAVHYFLPRDCPRIVITRSTNSNQDEVARFFAYSQAKKKIFVENRWYKQIKESKVYKYTFPVEPFELFDGVAGYYVSYQKVIPTKVEELGDLVDEILQTGTELIFTPNLFPLQEAISKSSLDFSIIRFRNAVNER